MDSLIVTNNLTSSYGIWGDATREGTLTLEAFVNNFKVENNAFVGLRQDCYPINNYYPQNIDDVGFVDYKLGNWKLSESSLYYSKNIGAG
ncbi:MAG TPA: hypothetical protein PLP33_14655 [Leptospiraceae bacterium]|nr:hypothetical protein [Leptospiraceae bacterium]